MLCMGHRGQKKYVVELDWVPLIQHSLIKNGDEGIFEQLMTVWKKQILERAIGIQK